MNSSVKNLLDKELLSGEVSALNALLTGEISAVETYKQAMQNLRNTEYISTLQECLSSHELRMHALQDRLADLGIASSENSGLWGSFARLVEGGAALLSDQAAIGLLTAGEEYGLNEYKLHLQALDPESWKIAQEKLVPEQIKTYRSMSFLNAIVRSDTNNDSQSLN